MSELFVGVLIFVSLISTLVAAATRETEKLLWGTILCSLGLGLSILISGGGYFGVLVISVFLLTDLLLYLYFRSLYVHPKKKLINKAADRMNRIFMLWMGLCGFIIAAISMHEFIENNPFSGDRLRPVALLHQRIWGEDWYILSLATMIIGLVAFGGFFLVRREKND